MGRSREGTLSSSVLVQTEEHFMGGKLGSQGRLPGLRRQEVPAGDSRYGLGRMLLMAFGCVRFTLSPGSLLCGESWPEEGMSSTVEAKPSMTVDGLEFEELRSKSAFFFLTCNLLCFILSFSPLPGYTSCILCPPFRRTQCGSRL